MVERGVQSVLDLAGQQLACKVDAQELRVGIDGLAAGHGGCWTAGRNDTTFGARHTRCVPSSFVCTVACFGTFAPLSFNREPTLVRLLVKGSFSLLAISCFWRTWNVPPDSTHSHRCADRHVRHGWSGNSPGRVWPSSAAAKGRHGRARASRGHCSLGTARSNVRCSWRAGCESSLRTRSLSLVRSLAGALGGTGIDSGFQTFYPNQAGSPWHVDTYRTSR